MENCMNVLEVNFADKVGHIFNGYDLHKSLIDRGINAKQVVIDKRTLDDSVIKLHTDMIMHQQIREIEKQYSISNLLYPYGAEFEGLREFQQADIVHYHILHNGMISLLDYPKLMNQKNSVWTIHDPWILTGGCIHPLDCQQWKYGCEGCNRFCDSILPMKCDNAAFMWQVKKAVLAKINPPHIIVSSSFMKKYLEQSPFTRHWDNITVIPFGIEIKKYDIDIKAVVKKKYSKRKEIVTIGFRVENDYIKGNKYLFDALRNVDHKENIKLLCVGSGHIPEDIKKRFSVTEFGWVDDEKKMAEFFLATDIFVMPSLAETFGLMAIEAMAAECLVICFENTVVSEVIEAPICGVAVEYLSDTKLCEAIEWLVNEPEEIERRGKIGREIVEQKYRWKDYVEKHIQLYKSLLN